MVTEIKSGPDVIQADERKLKQILYNLLSNAVKFTPDGCEVRLMAELATSPDLLSRISALMKDDSAALPNYLCISVKDTGIGIRREDLDRLFKAFEQMDSPAVRRHQGTGLGLALSRNFVKLHGGTIWAESEGEGKGSTFRFLLPF
jgi:signal transduction histidine kinase